MLCHQLPLHFALKPKSCCFIPVKHLLSFSLELGKTITENKMLWKMF